MPPDADEEDVHADEREYNDGDNAIDRVREAAWARWDRLELQHPCGFRSGCHRWRGL